MNEFVSKTATLKDVMYVLEHLKNMIVPILENNKIIGVISDGDVRRALLLGKTVESNVLDIMNTKPLIIYENQLKSNNTEFFKALKVTAAPLANNKGEYIKVLKDSYFDNDLVNNASLKFNAAVIMAGGEGQRMRPLTSKTPKPLVVVKGKPIIVSIIENLVKNNIQLIYISVNYMGNKIKEVIGDGSLFNCRIEYIEEDKKMGTAGSLSSLDTNVGSYLITNADLFTNCDYYSMLDYHLKGRCEITIASTIINYKLPFGLLETSKGTVKSVKEKPTKNYICNAGIYVLDHSAIKLIPKNLFFNMTDLIQKALDKSLLVKHFPLYETWEDFATVEDITLANKSVKN